MVFGFNAQEFCGRDVTATALSWLLALYGTKYSCRKHFAVYGELDHLQSVMLLVHIDSWKRSIFPEGENAL